MATDAELWARVRRLYVEGDEAITTFCKRLGVNPGTMRRRALKEGWPERRNGRAVVKAAARAAAKTAAKDAADGARDAPGSTRQKTRAARDALIRRFFRAISGKLTEWENAMSDAGEPPSAGADERRMKELGALIASFEKVADVAAGAQKLDDGSARKQPRGGLTSADTQRMRDEITRRLEHLHASRGAGQGSGEPAGAADPEPDA